MSAQSADRPLHALAALAAVVVASVTLLALLAGAGRQPTAAVSTLLYANDDEASVHVYAGSADSDDPSRQLGVVDASAVRCLALYALPGEGASRIAVRRVADPALYWSPVFYADAAPAWSIRVGRHPALEMLSLQPEAAACRAGR